MVFIRNIVQAIKKKGFHSQKPEASATFGIMFDIDGVIMRGARVLPQAQRAFKLLSDENGFRVPTIFVTNAGNCLSQMKADQLSQNLGLQITEEQVVMAPSPLKLFKEFHDKHVLVVGQGPVGEIAENLGFKKVTTMEEYRLVFPTLDAVDHERRKSIPYGLQSNSSSDFFPRIEAIVLFGEPTRWETSLQLLIDTLMTNGLPTSAPASIPYPHIPVLACNMDLQWMAEANMPRFGHGAFLLCLEHLYKKVTSKSLCYTALVGKPSEITYRYAEEVLQQEQAKLMFTRNDNPNPTAIKSMYFVGDNLCTDIFGANLYHQYLKNDRKMLDVNAQDINRRVHCRSIPYSSDLNLELGAENCYSILVETGVYSKESKDEDRFILNHSPRDFLPVHDTQILDPTMIVPDVANAVEAIFKREGFS